ncbi:MAG: hypothetical protein QM759_09415 [Terricaulis sp.]
MATVPWKEMALAAALGVAAPEMVSAQELVRAETNTFSDSELTAYAKARAEIEPMRLAEARATSAAEQARDESEIDAALARNGLTREDFDAIASVAAADAGLSARIAQLAETSDTPPGA